MQGSIAGQEGQGQQDQEEPSSSSMGAQQEQAGTRHIATALSEGDMADSQLSDGNSPLPAPEGEPDGVEEEPCELDW